MKIHLYSIWRLIQEFNTGQKSLIHLSNLFIYVYPQLAPLLVSRRPLGRHLTESPVWRVARPPRRKPEPPAAFQSSSGVQSMAAWSAPPSLRHLLLLRPRLPLSPTCLAGSFSRRHIHTHTHSRSRLFSSAASSSSTLIHGDAASTHGDADGVVDVNPPRGTRDFPPEDMRLRTWLFDQFREVSRLMAFEEVDFPVLESEALFIRKAGEEITQQVSLLHLFVFSSSSSLFSG